MVPGIVPDLLLFLLLLWLFDGIALLPVLLSSAVRRLVRTWPTDSLSGNYLVGVTLYAVSHLLVIMLPLFAVHGGSLERNVLQWIIGLTLLNTVIWWVFLSVVAPARGRWRPKQGEEYDGRIALTLGVFTYAVATGALAFVAVIVIIAVGFPG